MKKYFMGIIAIVVAVGFSAFTLPKAKSSPKNPETTLIWFEVHETTGEATNPDAGSVSVPGTCSTGNKYCARALEYPGEVTYDGSYHIGSGVDITTAYDDEAFKN